MIKKMTAEKIKKELEQKIEAFAFRDSRGIDLKENLQSLSLAIEDIINPIKSEGRKDD